MITQDLIPIPIPNTSAYVEYRLSRTERGTRLVQAVSKAVTGPFLGRFIVNLVMPTKRKEFDHDIQKFKRYIEEDYARRDSLPEGITPTSEMVAAAVSESLK
jgi:hypothetical protein